MFCFQCGTKLPDNARFCVNCGSKMPISNNQENGSKDATIVMRTTQSRKQMSLPAISKLYNDIFTISESVSEEYIKNLDDNYKTLDQFISRGLIDTRNLFSNTEKYAINMLHERSIYHYGIDEVRPYTRKYMLHTGEVLSQLCVTYEKLEGTTQETLAYNEYMRDNYSRFVGGGFGLKGAAKGIAVAGVLNASLGAFQSFVTNMNNNSVTANALARKNALFHNLSFREAFKFAIETDIKESIHGICDLFTDLGLEEIPYYPIENILQAGNILDAVVEGKVPPHGIERAAWQIINLFPVNRDMYIYAADICPEHKQDFIAQAKQYGLDVQAYYSDLDTSSKPYAVRLVKNEIAKYLINLNDLGQNYKSMMAVLYDAFSDSFKDRFYICVENGELPPTFGKMCKAFANYENNETPIVFIDSSSRGDGSRGVVLTDKKLYVSSKVESGRGTSSAVLKLPISEFENIRLVSRGIDLYIRFEYINYLDKKSFKDVQLPDGLYNWELYTNILSFFYYYFTYVANMYDIHVKSEMTDKEFVDRILRLSSIGNTTSIYSGR